MRCFRILVLPLLAAAALVLPTAAVAEPRLRAPAEKLRAALDCPQPLAAANRQPILLVHGTGAKPEENFGWNLWKVLPERGYTVCAVTLPRRSLPDIQRQTEYVVFAVRRMARRSGRRVDVIGHSQGTLQPRWAIKWWRSVRRKVNDYVSLAGPHRGTLAADAVCLPGFCAPSVWQMRRGSRFTAALNRGDDTPGRVAYTSISSQIDELVQPYSTTGLEGASNVPVQRVCPARPVTHVSIVFDAVAFALVLDALRHRGPADPDRLPLTICLRTVAPGVTLPAAPSASIVDSLGELEALSSTWPATSEPRLRPYARR